jgi:hypothetical protein
MPTSPIKRKTFLGYILMLLVLLRCRKETLTSPATPTTTTGGNTAPVNPQDAYMGQYTVTEAGSNLQPEPAYLSSFHGYTDKLSYLPGDTVNLYLSSSENTTMNMPLQNGLGETFLSVQVAVKQQKINSAKPWVDGFMYEKTISVKLPNDLKSGVYSFADIIPVVVRGTEPSYDLTVVYSSNTVNAYNFAGGKSLYAPDYPNRATVVSFNRPAPIVNSTFFAWLSQQGYNINYVADIDMDDYSQIENSKAVVTTGHSEYWSMLARQNIDTFVNSGRNLILLSGNNMWWQVRYNYSKNLMICYKSLSGNSYEDLTLDPLAKTIYHTVNWGINKGDYPIMGSIGADYRWGGYGMALPNKWGGYKIVKQDSPILRGSGLSNGDIFFMPSTEYDGTPVVSLFPPGSTEIPVIDNSVLNFYKVELLGYDFALNYIRKDLLGFGMFMVCQKTPASGVVINGASMDWCSNFALGAAADPIKIVTKNMIDLSLTNASIFSAAT